MMQFDLEQEIMNCWNITSDLKTLYEASDSINQSELQKALLGLHVLYEVKFNKLFETFEGMLREQYNERRGQGVETKT